MGYLENFVEVLVFYTFYNSADADKPTLPLVPLAKKYPEEFVNKTAST